jgi:hypothetical protein
LFDLLLGYEFADVTSNDFSQQAVEMALAQSQPSVVKSRYDSAVNNAIFWSGTHGFDDLWDVVEKHYDRTLSYLDETQKKLFRLMGIPPTGDKTSSH